MNMEHGTWIWNFHAIVFSTGGEGLETFMFHKCIVQKIANKTEEKYEEVQTLTRCKLSFLILRLVLLSTRGNCSVSKNTVDLNGISLTCSAECLL